MLDLGEQSQYEYVTATVIGREISPFLQYIIIDKGSEDGIQYGMPVVTQQGLVGRVDAVIAAASRIKLITDSTAVVNVFLQTADVEAQLNGSLTGDLSLDMIPLDSYVEAGDVVLTSGLGGNYPPNIFVGQVLSVQNGITPSSRPLPSSLLSILRVSMLCWSSPILKRLISHPNSGVNLVIAHLACALSILVAYLLQTAIISQTPLVNGTADLILLFFAAWTLNERVENSWLWAFIGGVIISMLSAMPFYVPLIGYLGVVGLAKFCSVGSGSADPGDVHCDVNSYFITTIYLYRCTAGQWCTDYLGPGLDAVIFQAYY